MLEDVQLTQLPNGLRVVTCPQPAAESVAVGFWIGVGGRHEPSRLSGASHFIEHMLFKGTRRRSAKAISQAIEGRGGYLNAYTQEDCTCYYARLPHERLHEAFDVLGDMYLEPRFAPADLERERAVIIEELRMYRDQPQSLVQEQLQEALWPGHPLGRPLSGAERTVSAMTRADLDGFRRRHYTPAATVMAFAGRVRHATCVDLATRGMGGLNGGRRPAMRAVDAHLRQERIRLLRRDIEQVHAAIGFRTFGRHDERRYALRMLNGVLGENMSSRLFQVVRERHGLAYSVQSSYQLFHETGALTVSAGLDRARAPKALVLIAREIARVRDQGVSAAEWRRTRDYLLGQFRLGLEDAGSQMNWVGETLTHYGRLIPPAEAMARLAAVTREDLTAVARSMLGTRHMTVALVVPRDDARDEQAWLATLAGVEDLTMRLRLIACNVFQREACLALVHTPHVVDVTFIELGEHERPDGLRALIQAQIDAASAAASPYDAILVLFGLCGNATVGLVARDVPLMIPRAHDCATILLGGREAFKRYFADNPSRSFGCGGYCERGNEHMLRAPGSVVDTEQAEYAAYVRQYGEENAKFIWESLHPPRPDDRQSCYIRVAETDLAGLAARFRSRAVANGREYVELAGSMRLIDALICGAWEGGEFLRVAPGQTTVGRYDWDEVIAAG